MVVVFSGCGGAGGADPALEVVTEVVDSSSQPGEIGEVAPDSTAKELSPSLLPGPGGEGYDPALEALARKYDRQFHLFNALGMALNADIVVPLDNAEGRVLVEKFLRETDGWDFEGYAGKHQFDVVSGWQKVAGLYGGVGIAADAYRYGVLRDQGYPAEEVELARQHLLDALDGLHLAVAITGVEGVIARGFVRTDIPGNGGDIPLVPLFDEAGNPLPEPKNNGSWREDNSAGGLYPNYVWEDSCSRDQYIGWVAAFAGAWEVIRDDSSIPDDVKVRVKEDALVVGRELMVVRASGYDLEIPDADGRTTFHGYMNENNLDKMYLPGIRNGFYALMALGSAAAWVYVTEDSEMEAWLYESLIAERELHVISAEPQTWVNQGAKSNFSNQNMAFMGAWLALRYLDKEKGSEAMSKLQKTLGTRLYDSGEANQPKEMKTSLFDFVYAAAMAGSGARQPMAVAPDADAVARGVETLLAFPEPPYWEVAKENCDAQELAELQCTLLDGSEVELLGNIGWNDDMIANVPIPMAIRPSSNYHWRSNPYKPNGGGDGSRMAPGVDFRYAYWLGRWAR